VDLSANELARLKWEQAKAAAGVGAGAWRGHGVQDVRPAERPDVLLMTQNDRCLMSVDALGATHLTRSGWRPGRRMA